MKPNLLDKIKATTDERRLLALAYACEGAMVLHTITIEHHTECMLELSRKLGFGITPHNLRKASAKYIEGDA